ncbi:aldose 1-epimerase [Catalinimonas alkaloidigena]|uniref:aldose epimerase family protein n=1 Tax=Catalinimonas alkaloidigena TaxID=1075417 RepID=UPI0024059FC9|nr:aldose epimerase family protein [Catalinimonas alkaloidigena]MDF9796445.1 aldose 1-epimerase [Catalinimonas alkaloidigena]
MKIEKKPFGQIDGQTIDQYILSNNNGLVLGIINYGATISSIIVPSARQGRADVVCGFNQIDGYLSEAYQNNAPYFGATVGRYAGRIKDAQFVLGGELYQLEANDGDNHLHGGKLGFDKRIWKSETLEEDDAVGVKMSLISQHMEEGYPGQVEVNIYFRMNDNNEISIRYQANTDRVTPISLTNHTYFNLSGFKDNIMSHLACIVSDSYLQPDASNVPDGSISKVENTPADLRKPKPLGVCIDKMEMGFEHYFLFEKDSRLREVASFTEEKSGRGIKVFTTEPGMLFYTGYYTSDQLQRENGDQYGQFRAFCCETSRYINGPNIASSPGSVTTPDEPYESETVLAFEW